MWACSRFALTALLCLCTAALGRCASPRDEALHLAPPDAAFVAVVQHAREHAQNLRESPFVGWLPQSTLGKQFLGKGGLKAILDKIGPICRELGTNPEEVLKDVLGDAVVFAYSPASADQRHVERAVLLIRPRKPETLQRIVDRVNTLQLKSGELSVLTPRTYKSEPFFERKKAHGASDFYCFRGGVFAFSSTEADIHAVIDRSKLDPTSRTELAQRIKHLEVGHAAAFVLVNPRALDAEFTLSIAAARPEERATLEKFRDIWAATKYGALYLTLDRDLQAGCSIRFDAEKMPAWARGWLSGAKLPSALWLAVPENAIFAFGGRCTALEVLDLILAVLPDDGKHAINKAIAETLGPIVGKNKLTHILKSLGPDWAVWAEPPENNAVLPTFVAAVRIQGANTDNKSAAKAILQAIEFGFQSIRVAYNGSHADQIEILETEDGTITITSLVNDKLFPAGCRPSFALKSGYLLLTSHPGAIRRFIAPHDSGTSTEPAILARFSGIATRQYLKKHGTQLAAFLTSLGGSDKKELTKHFAQLDAVLELVDSANVYVRGDMNHLRISIQLKLAKPLKK